MITIKKANLQFPLKEERCDRHVKLTVDVITCLICTLIDFPLFTLEQGTFYIKNSNGATNKIIKLSTLGKYAKI